MRSLVLVLCFFVSSMAMAQEQTIPDYKSWEAFAKSVQSELSENRSQVSDTKLEELRQNVVGWRDQFNKARDTNAGQIQTLREQIDALGPAPAEGETEEDAISRRRSELNDQLSKLQSPGISATEAATRADGLIRSIDTELRERSTDQLLRLSPSPLNPVNWGQVLVLASRISGMLYDDAASQLQGADRFAQFRTNAPLIVGLVLIGLVLLVRSQSWMDHLSRRLSARRSVRTRLVTEMVISVGQIVLPLVGMSLLLLALSSSGLLGEKWQRLVIVMAGAALVMLYSAWLARRVFPRNDEETGPFNLIGQRRAEGRFLLVVLGGLLALWEPVGTWVLEQAQLLMKGTTETAAAASTAATNMDAALAAMAFPLQVLAGVTLYRIGALLRRHVHNDSVKTDDRAFRDSIINLLGLATIVAAIIGPVLGAIGYVNAANAVIWPMAKTLFVIGLVVTLQRFFAELYVVMTHKEQDERDGLAPIFVGFLLTLASLPFLALVWGARVEDLSELWNSFRQGLDIGGVRISPTIFLTLVVVFSIGFAVMRGVQAGLRSTILPKTKIDKGGQNAILSGISYIGVTLAALVAVSSAGIDLSSLAIVAGALSLGIGFGLQTIVQNFVSGIILLVERPISEGDWIEVGTEMGVVKAISVRSTRIETFDRTEVIVPNADLISGRVTNWTRGNMTGRLIVPVGVAYGSDTRRVEAILLEIAEDQPTVMMDPEPQVVFSGFGADSLNFEIRVILSDVNFKLRVMTDINHQIAARFQKDGIEIPFAQRDIWLRNPEALSGRREDRPDRWRDADHLPDATAQIPKSAKELGTPRPGEGMESLSFTDPDGGDADGDGDGGR
ncbi:mechanosensitive ion channel family protein [Rhodobacteraceae bacterium]|nr:mechanosensitive ion channel family protein [Paracoccaceae bacterium]